MLTKLNLKNLPRRFLAFDCETTGLDPSEGDRIVSIAFVEWLSDEDRIGVYRYFVFNPERSSHPAAARIHGWTSDILQYQDLFSDRASEILDFIRDDILIAHNAEFDITFLDAELRLSGHPISQNSTFCTMQAYKKLFRNRRASLDRAVGHLAPTNVQEMMADWHHDALFDASQALQLFRVILHSDIVNYARRESPIEKEWVTLRPLYPPQNLIEKPVWRTKLSSEQIADARKAALEGENLGQLSARFGVSTATLTKYFRRLRAGVPDSYFSDQIGLQKLLDRRPQA